MSQGKITYVILSSQVEIKMQPKLMMVTSPWKFRRSCWGRPPMTSMSCLSTSEPRHFGATSRSDGGLGLGLLSFSSVVISTIPGTGRPSSLDMLDNLEVRARGKSVAPYIRGRKMMMRVKIRMRARKSKCGVVLPYLLEGHAAETGQNGDTVCCSINTTLCSDEFLFAGMRRSL